MRASSAAATTVASQQHHSSCRVHFVHKQQSVMSPHRQLSCPKTSPGLKASSRRSVRCCCQHTFVLYTKPECPLCDGLKDKLQALIDRAAFMPCLLTGASLEVRDISTNEAWQDAMHLSVPVLVVLNSEGQEVVLPRPQPRVSADRLQQHLQAALQAAGISADSSSSSSGDSAADQPFTVIS